MKKILNDVYNSLFFMMFAIVLILVVIPQQIQLQSIFGSTTSGINGRTFPYIVTSVMLMASLIHFVTSIVSYRKLKKNNEDALVQEKQSFKQKWGKQLVMVTLFCVYVTLFINTGAIIATLVIFPTILWVLGEKRSIYYVYVLAFAAIIYCIFRFVLLIPLP